MTKSGKLATTAAKELRPTTEMSFAVLPTPLDYQLVTIDDDDGDPIIENRISEPEIVLGFVIRTQQHYFSVLPVTTSTVHDDGGCGRYALIRPNGKVDFDYFGHHYVFDSLDDWKQFMRHRAAESYEEAAKETATDKKDAALFRRAARAHRKQIEENE